MEPGRKPAPLGAENRVNISVAHIEQYVKRNIIPATKGVGCVDPRPLVNPQEENRGETRMPGGDFGYVMAVMAAVPTLAPERAVTLVNEWVTQREGRPFSTHTDDHGHDASHIGCGHIARSSEKGRESLYGVSAARVREAYEIASQLPNKKVVTLSGDHREQGAFVVIGDDNTVNPNDGNEMYFRFDQTRTDRDIGNLAFYLQTKGIPIMTYSLMQTVQRQLEATLQLIAAGLPIFRIDFINKEQPQVTFVKNVPAQNS